MSDEPQSDNVPSAASHSILRIFSGALLTGLICALIGFVTGGTIGGNMDRGFQLAGHHYRNEYDTGQLGTWIGLTLGIAGAGILMLTCKTRLGTILVVVIGTWLIATTLESIVWVTAVNALGATEPDGKTSALIGLAIGTVGGATLMGLVARKLA